MAAFAVFFLLFLAGSLFGPAKYHPNPSEVQAPPIHESSDAGGR